MKHFHYLIILLLACCSSLNAQQSSATKEKTLEIFAAHAKAIGLPENGSAATQLSLTETAISNSVDIAGGKELISETSSKTVLDFESPCQVRTKLESDITSIFGGRKSNNQSVFESILNGDSYYSNAEAFIDGKKMDAPFKRPSREQAIAGEIRNAFPRLFPIVLEKFDCVPMEFDFVGIAESTDGRASVIGAVSQQGVTHKLFFDEKTHLLLMMFQVAVLQDGKKRERRYFYSDYKTMGGLLVPTVVKIEIDGKLYETRELRSLNMKPAFKPDLFKTADKQAKMP